MKRKRFSVEQIIAAKKQHETGMSVSDISRSLGVVISTFGVTITCAVIHWIITHTYKLEFSLKKR